MIVKNISNKVINIGAHMLRPDEKLTGLSEAKANVPGIQALVKMGFLTIEQESTVQAAEAPASADEAAAEGEQATAEDATPAEDAKKTGRKSSAKSK